MTSDELSHCFVYSARREREYVGRSAIEALGGGFSFGCGRKPSKKKEMGRKKEKKKKKKSVKVEKDKKDKKMLRVRIEPRSLENLQELENRRDQFRFSVSVSVPVLMGTGTVKAPKKSPNQFTPNSHDTFSFSLSQFSLV